MTPGPDNRKNGPLYKEVGRRDTKNALQLWNIGRKGSTVLRSKQALPASTTASASARALVRSIVRRGSSTTTAYESNQSASFHTLAVSNIPADRGAGGGERGRAAELDGMIAFLKTCRRSSVRKTGPECKQVSERIRDAGMERSTHHQTLSERVVCRQTN